MVDIKFSLQLFATAYAGTFVADDVAVAATAAGVSTTAQNVFWNDGVDTGNIVISTDSTKAGHTLMGTVKKSGTTYIFTLSGDSVAYTEGTTPAEVTAGAAATTVNSSTTKGDGEEKFSVSSLGAVTINGGTWTAINAATPISTTTSVVVEDTANGITIAPISGTATATYTAKANITDVSNASITVDGANTAATKFTANAGVGTPAVNAVVEAKKGVESTFTVSTAGVMTLTSGEFTNNGFVAGAGVNVDATSPATVIYDGVTFSAKGAITAADAITVSSGTASVTAASSVTDVKAGTYDYVTTATTTAAVFDSTGNISAISNGTVKSAAGKNAVVGGDTYTNAGGPAAQLEFGKAGASSSAMGLVGGSVTLASTGVSSILGSNGGALEDTARVSSGTVTVVFATGAVTGVNGLDKGESFSITDKLGNIKTFEAITDTVVKVTGTGITNPLYYEGDYENAAFTFADPSGGLTATTGKDITVSSLTGTTWYDEMGFPLSSSTGAVVTVNRTANQVSVSGNFQRTIYLQNAAATVTDTTGDTTFAMDANSVTTIKGKGFTVDADGVISGTNTNTITVGGTDGAVTVSGSVNVNATGALAVTGNGTVVTYKAGADVAGAKVTLAGSKSVTLTEANNATGAVNTTISNLGAIAGLEGNATVVTSNVTSQTIATTNSGTFNINGRTYVVTGDEDGVTFTVDSLGATVDNVDLIQRLDRDATIAISGKFSSTRLQVGTTVFTSVSAADGITFTAADAAGNTTATLFAKGDKVTTPTGTYTVDAMGSASDGIVIGSNTLAALNDGDKITFDNGAGVTYTYEVSGSTMIVTDAAGAATTWTLSDSTDSGFTVSAANAGTVSNGDAGIATETVTFGGTAVGTTSQSTSLVDGEYINSDGSVTTSSDKAIARVNVSGDVVTYTSLSSKAQTVQVTAGSLDWNITTGTGKDVIGFSINTDASIDGGSGDDQINISGRGDKQVSAGEGKDTVIIAGSGASRVSLGAGSDTATAGGTGDVAIYGESGNNVISAYGKTSGDVTLTGGSGKDTITASGADDVVSGGDGEDTFNVSQSSMTISDYTYGTDVLQAATTAGTLTVTPTNFGGDGVVSVASGVTADVSAGTGTGEFYAVSLVDSTGKNKKNVAWAKEGGSTIDITTYDQAVTLIGDADGKNALYAGTKADDIYSYADNDSVYGGAGKDSISLATGATGRVVGVGTTSSKDTVSGFTASFEEGDSIYMVDGSASDVKVSFANNTVTFKDGEGSLQLNNVATSSATGAVELNVHGTKMALTGTNGVIATDSTSYADFYVGDDAAVSFATADGAVNVDLRNGLDSGAEGAKFSGITAVTGGAGNNTLIGSTAADSIYAGTGVSSLWGGAGKDTLVGNGASDAFFIGAGDGSDVVTNFSAAGNENADTVYALNDITGAKLTSNGVEISVGDTDKLTLKNVTADMAIKFNSNGNAGVAKVGSTTNANNFTYDSTVTYYGGGNKSDKIAFVSGSTENAEIWMDGSHGKTYASINVVDGANTSGNLLVAGDSSSQSIIGGKGDSSLWGGAGSVSDTLKSSSGSKTTFWWGAGEGNDLVVSTSADDSVNLYNLKLSDVDSANSSITNSGVVLALNDGSKLTVQSSRDVTFSIDGQSWTAQHNSKTWTQNS